MIMRLPKYISLTGGYSRRQVEKLIEEKKITINGRVAEIGSKIKKEDVIYVEGKCLTPKSSNIYIAFNKPIGVECTAEKKENNIIDFINYPQRIFPIGRLDKDSEGLILLTNDGDIVNKILKNENNNEKEYLVTLDKPITNRFMLTQMANGIEISGIITKQCLVSKVSENTIRIILTQGLNRQIRRMCESLGFEVTHLQRVRIMNITLENLEKGKWRELNEREIVHLKGKQ